MSRLLIQTIHRVPRVYAVTGNDKRVRFSLFLITFVEFAFGMYLSIRFALQPRMFLRWCQRK